MDQRTKQQYVKPVLEVVSLEPQDAVLTSNYSYNNGGGTVSPASIDKWEKRKALREKKRQKRQKIRRRRRNNRDKWDDFNKWVNS